MGFESALLVLRKHKKFLLGEIDIQKIQNLYCEFYKEDYANDSKSDEDLKKFIPVFVDRGIPAKSNDFDSNNLQDIRNRYFVNWQPCDLLAEFNFVSDFTELYHYYHMEYDKSKAAIVIPKEDMKDIAIAIRYLLSGKYSKDFEKILSNEWVERLGRNYPKYLSSSNKYSKPIYVDRNSDDSWTITRSDPQLENEAHESNLCWETNYKSVLQAIELVDRCPEWNNEEEFVLVYTTM